MRRRAELQQRVATADSLRVAQEEIEVLLLSAVSLDGEGDSDGYGGAGKHG